MEKILKDAKQQYNRYSVDTAEIKRRVFDELSRGKTRSLTSASRSKRLRTRRLSIAISLVLLSCVSAPVWAGSAITALETKHAISSHAYVVMDGYYYVLTRDAVDQSLVGQQVTTVNRSGEWANKQDGDSNYFPASDPVYSITGISPNKQVAIRFDSGSKFAPSSVYMVLQRADSVIAADSNKILNAKNDPHEVSIALENVSQQVNFLYDFQGVEKHALLTSVSYKSDHGSVVQLIYRVPEADQVDDTQGFLFVTESKNGSDGLNGSQPVQSLELNGIKWSIYQTGAAQGEKSGVYYNVQPQGGVTVQLITELLQHFKPLQSHHS